MSRVDEQRAAQALAYRLKDWGITDPHARAVGFIADLVEQGWRMDAARETRPHPPKPDAACRVCGRAAHAPDAVCDTPAHRPPTPADPATAADYTQRIRATLRATTTQEEA